MADLVHHVGVDVFDFWRQVAERRLQDPNGATESGWPPDHRLIPLLRENAKRLADVLEHGRLAEGGEAVLLRATDSIDHWLVRVADGRLAFDREPGPADVTAAAPLSDLLLLLWRRVTPADVDGEGDREALERFLARADLD